MDVLTVPASVREKLGDAASDGLVTMFADAHLIGTEQLNRRMAEASASFERRLADETGKLRLDMANLKFDLLKWNFLFWIGQVAVLVSVLSWMLRGIR